MKYSAWSGVNYGGLDGDFERNFTSHQGIIIVNEGPQSHLSSLSHIFTIIKHLLISAKQKIKVPTGYQDDHEHHQLLMLSQEPMDAAMYFPLSTHSKREIRSYRDSPLMNGYLKE